MQDRRQDKGYKEVTVTPFMIVAGDHANNDMAGDDDDSLKSVLEKEGYKVNCVIKGLGSYPSFQKMFAERAADCAPGDADCSNNTNNSNGGNNG